MPVLEIHSTDANQSLSYVLTGTGGIAKHNVSNDDTLQAERNDQIHRLPDNSYVVIGHTNDQNGDAFEVDQEPDGFRKYAGNSGYSIIYNGNNITNSIGEPPTDERPLEFLDREEIEKWHMTRYPHVADGTVLPDGVPYDGSEYNYYLDMRDADDHVDFSADAPEVAPGESVGFWINVHQAGTAGHAYGPGIATKATDGSTAHYDNFLTLRNDDGTAPKTSGTANVNLAGDKGTEFCSTDAFEVDLDNEEWHHIVIVHHSDGTLTWYVDGSEMTKRGTASGTSTWKFDYLGYGYPGSTNSGTGGKDMDELAMWNKELSATEVSDWYNNGTLPSDVAHLWEFDDNSNRTKATDTVGGFHGTINGCSYRFGGASVLSGASGSSGDGGTDDGSTDDGTDGGTTEPQGMQLNGPLEIASTSQTPAMEYTFEVQGTVGSGSSLEDADTITPGEPTVVNGTVGPSGADTYNIDGYVVSWEAINVDTNANVDESKYDTIYDGQEVGVWELLGNEEPEYLDSSEAVLGGGQYYSRKITESDADYVVTSLAEARDTLNNLASSGEIVFVPGYVEMYSPSKSERLNVPSGVTFASNRGVDGSDGALIHTDAQYSYGADGLIRAQDNARVTGLRVRGPHPNVRWRTHSYDYEMSGIRARGSNVEIDNNEVWGWAINIRASTDSHVHHNYSWKANMEGLGYAVSTGGSEGAIIEYNHFEHWRHVVGSSGGGGYEARHNIIDGPCISHAFDQHTPGGTYTDLHHNTSRVMEHDTKSKDPVFAAFRGTDVQNAEVYKNWVQGNTQMPDENSTGWDDEFIIQAQASSWGDITYWDNHLGTSEPPSSDIGAPRSTSTGSYPSSDAPGYFDTVAGFYAETPDRLTEADCDVTVSTASELLSEVRNSGNTIWVADGATIDLSGSNQELIAEGVTIAGNRSPTDGRQGPLLYVTDNNYKWTFDTGNDNIRITGLRLRGPNVEVIDNYNPDTVRTFGLFFGENCRFDNNEIYGWPFAGLALGAQNYPVSHEVHHNYFHHCCMDGLGYGLELFNGHHEIHHNYFNWHRHCIAGFGRRGNGYTAYKNVVGPDHMGHAFDMHALRQNVDNEDTWVAGTLVEVRNNHFEYTRSFQGYDDEAFKIRGWPEDHVYIENNTFHHDAAPTTDGGQDGDAYLQTNTDGWTSLTAQNNTYGSTLTFDLP